MAGVQTREVRKKVVLLGDHAVGKTSCIKRFVTDTFDDKYIATLGTKISRKTMQITHQASATMLELMIWDVIGQRDFEMILSSAFRGAQGALLVCDLTRKQTLESLREYWMAKMYSEGLEVPMMVIGNKADLVDKREYGLDEINELALELGSEGFLTSAKTGENIEKVFEMLGGRLLGTGVSTPARQKVPRIAVEQKLSSGRPTLSKVLDAIITDFCQGMGRDAEYAMAIARQQAKAVNLDINNPTKTHAMALVNKLMKVELGALGQAEAMRKLEKRKNWIHQV